VVTLESFVARVVASKIIRNERKWHEFFFLAFQTIPINLFKTFIP